MTVSGIRRQPRSLIFRAAAIALMGLALLLVVRAGDYALATSGDSPYDGPVRRRHEPDPNIVETTIVADEADVDIGNGVRRTS